MASLKKLLLVLSASVLAACAVKFDPVEHARIVNLHQLVQQAQEQNLCRDAVSARQAAQEIKREADYLLLYSRYIPNNDSMQKMAEEMVKSTNEFATRYSSGPVPSRVYCELKIKNLSAQIDIIQRTNARRPR